METVRAIVKAVDERHFIEIEVGDDKTKIPLSEDNPNEVKSAFNNLIIRLKGGKFQIELEAVGEDLFSQVAKEYIVQLNREILEVHGEMEDYGLAET